MMVSALVRRSGAFQKQEIAQSLIGIPDIQVPFTVSVLLFPLNYLLDTENVIIVHRQTSVTNFK
jgi:hypothetical protein